MRKIRVSSIMCDKWWNASLKLGFKNGEGISITRKNLRKFKKITKLSYREIYNDIYRYINNVGFVSLGKLSESECLNRVKDLVSNIDMSYPKENDPWLVSKFLLYKVTIER